MKRRTYQSFFLLMLFALAACVSLGSISGSAEYVAAARGQSVYKLTVAKERGMIYDCDMRPLLGGKETLVAAAAPSLEALGALEQATGGAYRERLAAALKDGKPFLLPVETPVVSPWVDTFRVRERYAEDQLAPHVVGYLDGLGGGASGIELAMDDVLRARGGEASVSYQMDALGRTVVGAGREVEDTLSRGKGGVQLTLSKTLQTLAETAGARLGTGAVVIAEAPDCALRAVASFPDFSPLNLSEAAAGADGALLNRAFCAYAPGSVFKLIPAAVLLEKGGDAAKETFTCRGSVNAGGLLFSCAGGTAHGTVDLTGAIEQSCNCYFINAARSLGGQEILGMAYNLGLAEEQEFGRGLFSAAGALPEAESLLNVRALANFAFGQGETLVTPVQMTAVLNAILSDGVYTSPRLISGTVSSDLAVTPAVSLTDKSLRAFGAQTAGALREMLQNAAANGTGHAGAPEGVACGIKTGTAQTGRWDENGEELMNYWYCGFVLGESGTRYSVTVLREGVARDEGVTAGVFREVAEALGGF